MQHPLDGARLKVVRAQQHLKLFKRVCRRYKKGKLTRFSFEQQIDSFKAALRPETDPPPSPILGCIVGDCVGNLRAALDYIAWEIAGRFHSQPLIHGDDKVYFPIFRLQADYRIGRLANYGLPTTAIQRFETVQPYHAGYEPLWHLHEIVNRDKHRVPVLTVGKITPTGPMSLSIRDASGTSRDASVALGIASSAHIDTSHITYPYKVEVNSQASIHVAFSDLPMPNEPADRTLEKIVECVANVIPRFDEFFI